MSNQVTVIPQGLQLPAHLQTPEAAAAIAAMNAAAAGGIKTGGYPKISIEGGKFHEVDASVDGGNPRTYMNPALANQPPTPMMCLEAVIVAANPALVKTFYAKKWQKGDDAAPDCQSSNGIVPDASVVNKQSPVCATCPQNQWGSKISEATGKEVKACTDSKQLVILPAAALDYKALGLQITPAALGDWGKYVKALSDRNYPVNSVVTNITFDHTASFPKLQFAFNRFLTADEYTQAVARGNGDDVNLIVSPMRTAAPAPALAAPVSAPALAAPPVTPPPVAADPFAGQPPHVLATVNQMGGLATAVGAAMYKTLTGIDWPVASAPQTPVPAAPPAPVAPIAPSAPTPPPQPPMMAGFGTPTPPLVTTSGPTTAAPVEPPKRTRRTRAEIAADAAAKVPAPAGSVDLSHMPEAIQQAIRAVGADSPAGQAMIAQFPPPAAPAAPAPQPAPPVAPAEAHKAQPSGVVPPVVAAPVQSGFGAAVAAAPVQTAPTPQVTAAGAALKDRLAALLAKPAAA